MMDTRDFAFRTHPTAIAEYRRRLVESRNAIMRPPPRMNVPDWADEYRYLSSSVGAIGGRWQTHRVEVARGPMMAVTEPGVTTITAMSCTQLLKTELLTNTFGYFAHLDPAPILLLEPKDEMAQAFSKERIAPMIASSPVLRDLMGNTNTRNKDDTQSFKKFPGGFLAMLGAGSPSNLAMRAIRVTLLDEVDKYETTKEGDPVLLAEERTSTFSHSSLHIRACSPTWADTSRIGKSYVSSDKRRPYVKCPHCDHEQSLDFFRHVQWEKDPDTGEHFPETAAIFCEACGAEWTEAERVQIMTTEGAIRHYQTRPFVHCGERQDPRQERLWDWVDDGLRQVGYAKCKKCGEHPVPNDHAGFAGISKLYSPFITVKQLVEKWLEAKDDPEAKQTFYNTQLGELFEAEVQKAVHAHWLASRAEQYPAELPAGAIVLTAGIDVQPNGTNNTGRLEVEVVAWGAGEESWSVAAEVFIGDPAKPEVWEELDKFLLKPFRHELGFDMRVSAACVDSGGHNAHEVYAFARARINRNIWAIKGASDRGNQWSPIWPGSEREKQHKKFRVGFRPIILGVNAAKEAIRQRLLIEEAGPGYCHFPLGRSEGWFEQLTSEQLEVERKHGQSVRKWVKKKHVANEALDCRVYAYAALQGLIRVRRFNLANAAVKLLAYLEMKDVESPGLIGMTSVPATSSPSAPGRSGSLDAGRTAPRMTRSSFMSG